MRNIRAFTIVLTLVFGLLAAFATAGQPEPTSEARGTPGHLVRLEIDPMTSIVDVLPGRARDVINSSFVMISANCINCGTACPPSARTVRVILEATAAVDPGYGVSNLTTTNYGVTGVNYLGPPALNPGDRVAVIVRGDALSCTRTFKLYFSMCDTRPVNWEDDCPTPQ